MFLKDLEAFRPGERSRYADAIRAAEAAGQPVAGIWRLFAWRPAIAEPLSRLTQEVLRGPSPLSPGFRELIAAFTSARNRCLFWTSAHAAVAAHLLKDRALVDAVCRDAATAPIPARERALFAFLARLVDAPASVAQADVDALKADGWGDDAIFDAVTTCALFSFFNRWIDGTGVPDVPRGFYEQRLERHGDTGYAPNA